MPLRNEQVSYPAANGKDTIQAQIWYPEDAEPSCILQIVHGMCEYMGRYTAFAEFMAGSGIIVCGNDMSGHGQSKGSDGYGYFADKNGDQYLIEDVQSLTKMMKQRHPGLPVFLLGHSMGSFICRDYITKYGEQLSGIILSGTAGDNPMLGFAQFMTGLLQLIYGGKHRSKLLTTLSFGNYNDRYPEKRTIYDWISRDTAIVDKYAADEACTFMFTVSAYADLFRILKRISGDKWAEKVPKDKPYLLMSGTMDPVGGFSEGVRQVYNRLKKSGVKDITLQLYEGGRHEMLNEINRKEVFEDLLHWIKNSVSARETV